MMNQLGPWERIVIYKQLLKDIRDQCDDQREVIDDLIAKAEEKINTLVAPNCSHCWDTGYEDARGYCRCRNKCTVR